MAATLLYKGSEKVQTKYYDRKSKYSQEEYFQRLEITTTLYVGNLSIATSEDSIFQFFSQVGQVQQLHMGINKQGQPAGFCFIIYKTHEEAQLAVEYLSQLKLEDRIIRVDFDVGYDPSRKIGRGEHGLQVRDCMRKSQDSQRLNIQNYQNSNNNNYNPQHNKQQGIGYNNNNDRGQSQGGYRGNNYNNNRGGGNRGGFVPRGGERGGYNNNRGGSSDHSNNSNYHQNNYNNNRGGGYTPRGSDRGGDRGDRGGYRGRGGNRGNDRGGRGGSSGSNVRNNYSNSGNNNNYKRSRGDSMYEENSNGFEGQKKQYQQQQQYNNKNNNNSDSD